ncbi:hypothetical protein B296_00000952 [Ensete ventricosum]|uniref:RIN4 pathogenic type III effector avirulence factor Avr cleavage site domain-containing protein n=1 Tax=Ensete ventricosum TaxID=4639 RepID=A0A427AF78_ENSVE|nr:hypothetical protein B296_00000952 [Ensete ventricosum]
MKRSRAQKPAIGSYLTTVICDLQQRGHVPRFGDWNENAAYTTCFDTARKGKAAGGNIVNPNDPEQSPELHKPAAMAAAEPQHPKHGRRDKAVEYNVANQHHQGANYGREERQFQGYAQATPQPRGSGGQRTGARRNPGEAGYVRSPSPVTQGRAANARQNVAVRIFSSPSPPNLPFGDLCSACEACMLNGDRGAKDPRRYPSSANGMRRTRNHPQDTRSSSTRLKRKRRPPLLGSPQFQFNLHHLRPPTGRTTTTHTGLGYAPSSVSCILHALLDALPSSNPAGATNGQQLFPCLRPSVRF